MAEQATFDVIVPGPVRTSLEAWARAQHAPASELPEVSAEDVEHANKFGMSEEQYARQRLAERYSIEQVQERGAQFGRIVQKLLDSISSGHRLLAVKREASRERWIVRVETPLGPANIAVPENLVNEVLDSYTIQGLDQLKSLVSTNIGRKDLIALQ